MFSCVGAPQLYSPCKPQRKYGVLSRKATPKLLAIKAHKDMRGHLRLPSFRSISGANTAHLRTQDRAKSFAVLTEGAVESSKSNFPKKPSSKETVEDSLNLIDWPAVCAQVGFNW
jgi:hypothetical protein